MTPLQRWRRQLAARTPQRMQLLQSLARQTMKGLQKSPVARAVPMPRPMPMRGQLRMLQTAQLLRQLPCCCRRCRRCRSYPKMTTREWGLQAALLLLLPGCPAEKAKTTMTRRALRLLRRRTMRCLSLAQ